MRRPRRRTNFYISFVYFKSIIPECLALTKADIGLKKNTLTVNKTMVFNKNTPTTTQSLMQGITQYPFQTVQNPF